MFFGNVWKCDYGCFLKYFYSEMHQNNIFFIFKKLFLISAHQNDLKTQKKNINFLGIGLQPTMQGNFNNSSLVYI